MLLVKQMIFTVTFKQNIQIYWLETADANTRTSRCRKQRSCHAVQYTGGIFFEWTFSWRNHAVGNSKQSSRFYLVELRYDWAGKSISCIDISGVDYAKAGLRTVLYWPINILNLSFRMKLQLFIKDDGLVFCPSYNLE